MSKFSKPCYLVVWSSLGIEFMPSWLGTVPGTHVLHWVSFQDPKELHTTRYHGFENLLIFRNSVSWHSMAHISIFWPWIMVNFILEESPWKSLQLSSSGYWKSDFLFPQASGSCQTSSGGILSNYWGFVTSLNEFLRIRGKRLIEVLNGKALIITGLFSLLL